MVRKMTEENRTRFNWAIKSFGINLLIALVIFVPFIILGNGMLTLSEDFDAQELAFNIFANREIKAGNVFFNWSIDIGSDFIYSLSFYNLGSPFFWITLPFNPEVFPWLIGWILILKYACCGLFSWLWLERYTDRTAALFGCILYAFSGFQAMNMIFYHFHDAVTFFPLLLLGFDYCAEKNRRGLFALAVGLNALVNWNFFIGEVLFLFLYYLVRFRVLSRMKERAFSEVGIQFVHLFGEGVLGVGIAAALFIPTVLITLTMDRITDHIALSDAFLWSMEDFLRNMKAFLLPAEAMNNNSALAEVNWYSAGAYLPFVGIIPVAAYMWIKRGKKDWLSRLILICLLLTAVPVLNNVFVLFNIEPYRRWYYMLILLMALASARIFAQLAQGENKCAGIVVRISLVVILTTLLLGITMQNWTLSESEPSAIINPGNWSIIFWLGIGGMVLAALVAAYSKRGRFLWQFLLVGVMLWSVISHVLVITEYREKAEYNSIEVYDKLLGTTRELDSNILPYRYSVLDEGGYYNISMARSLTSIDSFISTVEPGIFTFYESLGYPRHNTTPTGPNGTDRILSVKRYLTTYPELLGFDDQTPIAEYTSDSIALDVYDDYYAQPIGFAYDTYITKSEFLELPAEDRAIAMLNDLVVRDEDESGVADILKHADASEYASRGGTVIPEKDIKARDQSIDFVAGKRSFGAHIIAKKDQWAFFSVPYSDRWRAEVNGEPQKILNINGLMAVPVTKGDNYIKFYYRVWVNIASAIVSVISFAVAIALWRLDVRKLSNGKG